MHGTDLVKLRKINYALGVRARLSPILFPVKVKVIYEGVKIDLLA